MSAGVDGTFALCDDRTGSASDANVPLCHRQIQAGEILKAAA
jgi:hypothetical protein